MGNSQSFYLLKGIAAFQKWKLVYIAFQNDLTVEHFLENHFIRFMFHRIYFGKYYSRNILQYNISQDRKFWEERGGNFGTFPFVLAHGWQNSFLQLAPESWRNGTSLTVNASLVEFKKWDKIRREMLKYTAHLEPPMTEGSPTD